MSENNDAPVAEIEVAPLETEIQEQPIIEEAISEDSFVADASIEVQAETEGELKEEIAEAIEEGASEEEVKSMIKEFTLKVNGKEVTKSIDLSDEDAVRKELQMAMAGQSAMQKSRELEKTYEDEIKRLLADPYAVLEELGMDADDLAEKRIQQKIEELKKSPEQLERERIEIELNNARLELKKMQDEQENARSSSLEAEAANQLDTEINSALDAYSSLPKTPLTVNRIADTMLWAMENGFDDVTVADVIPTVEKEIKAEMSNLFDQLPDESLEQYFATKHQDRIRKKRINKVKTNNVNNIQETAKADALSLEDKIKEKVRSKDYFRNLK